MTGGREAEIELFLAWDGPRCRGPGGRDPQPHPQPGPRGEGRVLRFFRVHRPAGCGARPSGAVEKWAAERGATAVRGPMNPSTNYECGLLIEGFGRPPALMMTYNPPSYPRLIEGAGYAKVKDLHAYISPVHGASLKRLQRLAERTRDRNPTLTTRGADLSDFAGEVSLVQEIYNAAWEKNWGFVPMSDAEIDVVGQGAQTAGAEGSAALRPRRWRTGGFPARHARLEPGAGRSRRIAVAPPLEDPPPRAQEQTRDHGGAAAVHPGSQSRSTANGASRASCSAKACRRASKSATSGASTRGFSRTTNSPSARSG